MTIGDIRERAANAFRKRPRLTRRGQFVLTASLAILAMGLVAGKAVLVQLALFFLLLIPLAILASHINLRGVTYDHVLPAAVHRNETFTVEARLANTKPGFGAFDIEVIDEAISRHRTGPEVFSVGPCSSQTHLAPTRFRHRGVYEGFDYSLSSRFPLGLAEDRKSGRIVDRLTVCPWSGSAPDITPILEAGAGHGGFRSRVSSDFIGEFAAMRDYRMGDHPKRISWPFSIRFQKLIVKETEQPCPRSVSVLFHSYAPPGVVLSARSFENALELLAGLLEQLRANFIPFDFRAYFNDWEPIATVGDSAGRNELTVLLATARMSPSRDISPLVRIMNSERRSSVVQLIVSNCPPAHWMHLLPPTGIPVFCMDTTGKLTTPLREASLAL